MHSKLQILKFKDFLRIVIPTGNLTRHDWGETGVLENVGARHLSSTNVQTCLHPPPPDGVSH